MSPAGIGRRRRIVASFLSLPARRRLLALEAATLLAGARFLVRFAPMRWYSPLLGTRMAESEPEAPPEADAIAREVGWAVRTVARRTPWASVCLPQAMAARWMLRRRGVASTLYLGVAIEEEKGLLAHAWLRAGRRIVTGRDVMARYEPIARFA